MSFQVHIGLVGLSAAEAIESASCPPHREGLHVTYDQHYRLLDSPTVAISDSYGDTLANGLLSDNADWNADYWDLRPEYLDSLAHLAEQWFAKSPSGIAFFAGWVGDKPTPRTVALSELADVIRDNRLPKKTAFVLEKLPKQSA